MPQPSPLLTVSIVTYRTSLDVLMPALMSLKVSGVDYDLVIVDNTQNDAYFESLQKRSNAPCIQSPVNKGYGYGHNLAMRYLPYAPYHLVLNPDVRMHEGCLKKLLAAIERMQDVGLIVPRVHYEDGRLQELNKRDPSVFALFMRRFVPKWIRALPPFKRRLDYYVMQDIGYDAPCDVEYASGCFMLFRRSVWDAIAGFDEKFFLYMEDADITRRARAVARVLFWPEASITHLWARGSHNSLWLTLVTIASAIYYFRKWGWKWR